MCAHRVVGVGVRCRATDPWILTYNRVGTRVFDVYGAGGPFDARLRRGHLGAQGGVRLTRGHAGRTTVLAHAGPVVTVAVNTATAVDEVAVVRVVSASASAVRGHAVFEALDRAESALAATLQQLLGLEVKRVEQAVGYARIVAAEAPEGFARKHPRFLVGVGDSLLDTGLNELHVLFQVLRLPGLQQLVEELAAVAAYLFGARADSTADEWY